ncbi:hypothetical protein CEXT_457621 [Caerostris extrusa]|uniref:Secreted protein n=1 Tax=Caerostris extrusa TaxID=172846 RepID=A0AAV4PYB8_CAEEX|nr:hypothetical protein CEXT_457621 [Caerostris extrusa]
MVLVSVTVVSLLYKLWWQTNEIFGASERIMFVCSTSSTCVWLLSVRTHLHMGPTLRRPEMRHRYVCSSLLPVDPNLCLKISTSLILRADVGCNLSFSWTPATSRKRNKTIQC